MSRPVQLQSGERRVRLTSPDRLVFPAIGVTKLELARYYDAVGEAAVRAIEGRPLVLKRFPAGLAERPFFQKRAPASRPPWIETVTFPFPSGRTADEVVVREPAALLWLVQIGCVDVNAHPVRADDLDHPDELRLDLDPVPGVQWAQIREVALLVGELLTEHGLVSWPKTSGSRGMHVYARIERRWGFDEVRRAALAVAREVERRAPGRATSRWWKEEREGVFLDYNQNARDRTTASAWSVRPVPDARVSMPLSWDDVPTCDPAAFTLRTAPDRLRVDGDPHAEMDRAAGSLDGLLALAAAQEARGEGEAPLPPHFPKAAGEPVRAPPSKRRERPVVVVALSEDEAAAREGLARWKARHPEVVPHLRPRDVLVDAMRGRYSTWTRIRINLENVPEVLRPGPEAPDPDEPPVPA